MRIECDGKRGGIVVASGTLTGHGVRAVELGLGQGLDQNSGQYHYANTVGFLQPYTTNLFVIFFKYFLKRMIYPRKGGCPHQ